MKTIFNTLFITAAAVFAFSCEKPANDNITPSEKNLVELTLTVGADTKTQLGGENNTSIIWQENDKLIVFDGTANREFVIKDFEPGKKSAVFTGLALPAEKYYVVHSTAEGSDPVFTVPEEGDPYVTGILVANVQKAVKGSYDPAAFASVGIAEVKEGETDLSVQMRNTCSLVKVSLKSSDIKTIEISTTDESKYLTAKCKYIIKEYPGIYAQSDRYLSAVLDSESAMEPGDYYIAILPRDLTNLTVKYTKTDGSTASVTATDSFKFNRSDIVPLGIDDSALEFSNEELVLTVDFSSQPFTTEIPTFASDAAESIYKNLDVGGVEYQFVIHAASRSNYSKGKIQLNIDAAGSGYICVPAITGKILKKVEVTMASTNKTIKITNNGDGTGEQAMAASIANGATASLELSNPVAGRSYYVYFFQNKVYISKLVLTYTPVTE